MVWYIAYVLRLYNNCLTQSSTLFKRTVQNLICVNDVHGCDAFLDEGKEHWQWRGLLLYQLLEHIVVPVTVTTCIIFICHFLYRISSSRRRLSYASFIVSDTLVLINPLERTVTYKRQPISEPVVALQWDLIQNTSISLKKMHFKKSSAKYRPFGLSLNVLSVMP